MKSGFCIVYRSFVIVTGLNSNLILPQSQFHLVIYYSGLTYHLDFDIIGFPAISQLIYCCHD